MDHHDDDPAEQLRRAQARHEAERADVTRYESLDSEDTRTIPAVRRHRGRRWAIGAAGAFDGASEGAPAGLDGASVGDAVGVPASAGCTWTG
jgi:hypothetical protein